MREGVRWLARISDWSRIRRECCQHYLDLLKGCSSLLLPGYSYAQPLYYFPVRSKRKREVLDQARRRGIELIAWPDRTPIYGVEDTSQLKQYGLDPATCPVATELAAELIGLPTHDKITPKHRQQIVNLLRSYA
jgi:dTDP-4-amino-4,6-dideoxygalactose transaminase